ncbi:SRPBCC family protein [Allokutzneria sp. A3M-2-11 16]|uniref:SRPBCC family protein n=1 Tax=Allokutzneria sp. A3M-2-11 16 TaxID=2962043 RepID=UPI0020B6CA49|nr:SRPBCC family protein [Allokutzneria sp. A3M-2-11 16]MCP3797747.1 SRPBCC family protein [Allokutzneria sp. A3M-2-11 16]
MIHNVHERELPVDTATAGALLDDLLDLDRTIWPVDRWAPMAMDRPLGVGARGGHGPIRYDCTAYEPGRLVEFTFTPKMGLKGTQALEVLPGPRPGTSLLRHTATGRTVGLMRLLWPLAIRWLHDALLEDLLDRAATAVGHPPAQPARWPLWTRLCYRFIEPKPTTPARVAQSSSTPNPTPNDR